MSKFLHLIMGWYPSDTAEIIELRIKNISEIFLLLLLNLFYSRIYQMQNNNFKEILIFVTGATTQIITETIYALAVTTPPIIPHKFYFITTSKGKELINKTLIENKILAILAKELNLPLPNIDDDTFVIAADEHGREIDDIRSEKENRIVGDLITSFIKEQAMDFSARLHCSLAGGRKTMSFYMGAALQLFGRPWDRLYHVLVTPEFESNPAFFFKPSKNTLIECRMPDGTAKKLNTKDAEINLVELPFIRLRHKVTLHKKGFNELVEEGQREIDTAIMQPPLQINLAERTITIGDTLMDAVPMEMFIYIVFLRQKTDRCKYDFRPYCLDCTDCFENLAEILTRPALERFAPDYEKIYRGQPMKSKELLDKWKEGMPPDVIRQNISKIKKTLKESLNDETLLPHYTISTMKNYGSSRYGVKAEKGKIIIE